MAPERHLERLKQHMEIALLTDMKRRLENDVITVSFERLQ